MADHVNFPRSRPKMYQADKSHASPTLTQCLITPCPKCMWHSECRWYNPPDFIVFSEYPGSERCPRSESNALFLFSPPSLAFTARRGRGTVDKVIIVPYPDQTLTPCCHISKTGRYIFSYSSEDRQWNCTWHHNYFMWRGNNRLLQHTEDWTMFICFLNILKFRMKWLTPVEDCGKWFIVWNTSVFSGFNSSLSCLDLSHEILIWGWGFLLFLLLCLWLKVYECVQWILTTHKKTSLKIVQEVSRRTVGLDVEWMRLEQTF